MAMRWSATTTTTPLGAFSGCAALPGPCLPAVLASLSHSVQQPCTKHRERSHLSQLPPHQVASVFYTTCKPNACQKAIKHGEVQAQFAPLHQAVKFGTVCPKCVCFMRYRRQFVRYGEFEQLMRLHHSNYLEVRSRPRVCTLWLLITVVHNLISADLTDVSCHTSNPMEGDEGHQGSSCCAFS